MALGKPTRPITAARQNQPEHNPMPAHKNRKRWCGGHEGREHTPQIVLTIQSFGHGMCDPNARWAPCLHQEKCSTCGRIMRWTLPINECPVISSTVV